ncbi:MAG: MBL fold metallo-hydrolase [Desulforegulaceae bacterium]|nr:MBL fold metallo-hydrolase [Desulforegulaceae bacterium]
MNKITITAVVENTAPTGMGLISEHGLSFLIENNGETILFDTGQGLAFENNMKVLGKDISKIEKVVLSHGHYDHTGALGLIAEKTAFELFAHPGCFLPKLASLDQINYLDIGCSFSKEYLESKGVKLKLSEKSQKVSKNIITIGEVEFTNDFEMIEEHFYSEINGKKIKDTIPDDLGIVIDTKKGNVLILGCTHRGIINTLTHVSKLVGSNKFHTVMGGLHLGGADSKKMDLIIEKLKDFEIENLITGHCTGRFAQVKLAGSKSVNHDFIELGMPYSF